MEIVDLTETLEDNQEVYPGDPEVKIEVANTYAEDGYLVRRLALGSHTGTHVDSFSHMYKDGDSLNKIPLERFCGETYLVDKNQMFPSGKGLLFKESVGIASLDKIIAAEPNFVGGVISESLERSLLKNEIVTFTNLVNLDLLPTGESFMFYGLPLKIKNGDGSPVRAVAILEN
ncbi:MAG: cyclase family protein [Bacillota bacterium]